MDNYKLTRLHRLTRNVLTILVLFYLADIAHSWRPYVLKMHSPSQTTWLPETMDYNSTIDENGKISFYLNVKRDLPNAFLHAIYIFADGDGNLTMVLANKTINFCAFLTDRKVDLVLKILFSVGEKYGRLPTHCPIKKKLYYVTNMKISAENLPPGMPEVKGILMFHLMGKINGNFKTYMSTNVSFSVEKVFKSTEKRIGSRKV